MQLSHSRMESYLACGKKYENHYIKRLRATTLSSALFFGGRVGETVQMMVLHLKDELTEEEAKIKGSDPYEFFDQLMSEVEINKVKHDLPTCPLIRYYKGDWDELLLNKEDKNIIDLYASENGFLGKDGEAFTFDDFYPSYKANDLDDEEMSYMNLMFYLSLRRKGHLMIDAYEKEILPKIVKVHSIEQKITLEEEGSDDSLIGFADLIVDYRLDETDDLYDELGGAVVTVLFDNKTASAKYKREKIENSQQLSLYNFALDIGIIGYIVMIKKIKHAKRGPRKGETFADTQVMLHRSVKEVEEEYIEIAGDVLNGIIDGVFEPNTESCFMYYQKCPYYDLCNKGSMEGLADMSHFVTNPDANRLEQHRRSG